MDSSGEEIPGIFQFSSELNLSLQPNEDAVVGVGKEESRNISCVHQNERLVLMAPFLTFSRANYNVLQAFIAALSVPFQHSVTTHDVDWQLVQCNSVTKRSGGGIYLF